MNEQKIYKSEAKKEFRELAKKKILNIVSGSPNSLEQKDLQALWGYLRATEADPDYDLYFDLYMALSDYAADVNSINFEELANLLNKIIYIENSKKTAN